ncbi:Multidrug resistance protein MdtK [compost metagenome]
MSQSKFTTESKRTLKLAAPIIVGQIGQTLIGLADTIMVGALGAVALGASAFAGSIFFVFLVFGMGILAPLAALFARAQGQDDYPRGGVLLHHGLGITLGVSFVLIGLLYLLMPRLGYLGQTAEVLEMGSSFFEIITWSILPSLLYQNYKQFTDGIGKTQIAMWVMTVGLILNVVGNYVLIHGHYGFPRLGLNGAAYATLVTRIFMALIMMVYVHQAPSLKKYLTERWSHRFDRHLLKSMMRLGIPNGLTYLFEVAAFSSAAVMMGWFGATPLAAHQIAISMASTSFMITVGIGIASSIRVGYELGRGDYQAARYAGFTSIKLGGAYMSLCALGFFAFREWIPTLYVADVDVIALTAQLFIVVALFEIFDGIQAVSIGALRGLSDTQWPSIIAFVAYWILGLPGGYVLAFHLGAGPVGIWVGLLIGLIVASTLMTWRFHILSRRFIKEQV